MQVQRSTRGQLIMACIARRPLPCLIWRAIPRVQFTEVRKKETAKMMNKGFKIDFDANGVLIVGALDKSTGKSTQITINTEKGCSSQAEVNHRARNIEKDRGEKETNMDKVVAKNGLVPTMRNTRNEEMPRENMAGDKDRNATAETALQKILGLIGEEQLAEKDEFESRRKTWSTLSK
ncbi:unnamed protein product [Polarella glacialis]|uniref:Uncharacterized protein n=1 Tax=Polarella glacialis TaxID=89957 RepID=A0A813G5K7_POLGL|nr:unnamed protein product [Polarella glacialis]CAE8708827.1 unnamed protein product [Polarella glacialis]